MKELFPSNKFRKETNVQTRDVPKKLEGFGASLEAEETSRLDNIAAAIVSGYLESPQSIIMGDNWHLRLSRGGGAQPNLCVTGSQHGPQTLRYLSPQIIGVDQHHRLGVCYLCTQLR